MLAYLALVLSVHVRVYDGYGMPRGELTAARTVVARILKDADIDVQWAECPCAAPVGPTELMVRVVASTPKSEPASLGFSYVDVERRIGTLATVFADRVRGLAASAGVDEGELTGRAMAHEIGHLLLGTRDHERTGLMRGTWTSIELARNHPLDWQLSRADAVRLRQGLVRRLQVRDPMAFS